ncbi:exodeoxyribonuclease VII large subunit [Companilactobacillus pabuli]|jgi:exodeoxyribonuclease VII large subunit|uniref:Exodeoxyribonuclease 7 large subunit n=1 Tax=Companilactobacillus pabuli TaxID=2714036 RepID=A0A7L7KY99_9LACO|nr:exodeoxyribonuclease VII large subunit [Companilactobacillus pabuli]AKP03672.1 exodeoxyribonuclease VII large subunit [Companilactobacillus farciminis]AKS51977.1 exodeoxyribonuclease VII large subunit [Companilactobacillus farciminis]MDG5112884.1 exodeoxyribonuclease VII large subunit [Companilactobacillus pabuli]QMT84342.1 exodeoxyribonuclease VII large subunit [Companilactobacillus pabuli]GAQ00534.1 exodeoxyribonuclease VII large subunit [Companilactobacillus farciminis]
MDNEQYLTVTALSQYLKRKFDVDPYLGHVYLMGEISNFRLRPHAHQYFSLKDDKAKISAIMFKSNFEKIKFKPEEGMQVLVQGRISLYEPAGSYQIYVESMEPAGLGALYVAFEQLKKKLSQQGVFDLPKKPIPQFPKRIAVVTSESGAVIHDIMTIVARRFPIVQLVLYPAQVQGDEAAKTIVAQLKRINEDGNFDTIIIGRGGGSIEDLWPFNEEIVAQAIVSSKIPVISSVGHETDTTIADLVADLRAATPTAAAELATPVLSDVLEHLQDLHTRLYSAQNNLINNYKDRVQTLSQNVFLQHPERIYEVYLQKVDSLEDKLRQNLNNSLNRSKTELIQYANRLVRVSPRDQIYSYNNQVNRQYQILINNINKILNKNRNVFNSQVATLDSLSPLKTLSRGFAIPMNQKGRVLTKASDYQVDQTVNLRVKDGNVKLITKEISEDNNG